jgi:hypothetical protein
MESTWQKFNEKFNKTTRQKKRSYSDLLGNCSRAVYYTISTTKKVTHKSPI